MQTYGGGTSLKSKISYEEVNECILWLSIIFITILCTPQPTIVRWSPTSAVSDEIKLQWKGFCAIIANAYYLRGMAWLPVKHFKWCKWQLWGDLKSHQLVGGVWLNICNNLNKPVVDNKPLRSFFKGVVGSGSNNLFWFDPWLEEFPLKEVYPELFRLEIVKNCSVRDRLEGGWLLVVEARSRVGRGKRGIGWAFR
ncbi:hypothetical protein Hdeb2414_s0008g00281311 [Helianthus debilis subsp. tardiflorus]